MALDELIYRVIDAILSVSCHLTIQSIMDVLIVQPAHFQNNQFYNSNKFSRFFISVMYQLILSRQFVNRTSDLYITVAQTVSLNSLVLTGLTTWCSSGIKCQHSGCQVTPVW